MLHSLSAHKAEFSLPVPALPPVPASLPGFLPPRRCYNIPVEPYMQTNRRTFLMASGLTAAAATRAFGANDTIRLGLIGCGGRMRTLAGAAKKAIGCQIVAVCDVYEPRRDEFREKSDNLASTHLDYHDVLARKDVDAIVIASPNHWHL